MGEQTIRHAVEWIYRYNLAADPLTLFWHAGEPLTLSPKWYERAVAQIATAVPRFAAIEYRLQTNATLVDDRWCEFFLRHNFKIGLSLDGPAWLHDGRRRSRQGLGTHAATMRGVRTLQRHNIPFHVICVVTRETLAAPDELAEFFLSEGIDRIALNVEEIEGINISSSLYNEETRGHFALFLTRFLDRAEKSPRLRVREVESMLNWLLSPGFDHARGNEQNTPFEIITVTHNGDIATFSPELVGLSHPIFGDFTFGNVASTSLDEILSSRRFQILARQIADGVTACAKQCSYFQLCRGGAPANKLAEHGEFSATETLFCSLAEKAVADVVLRRLEGRVRGV